MDMNFIFSCSTRYLRLDISTRYLRSSSWPLEDKIHILYICIIISLSDLVIMCKIQKNSYFQTRLKRLSIIHIERFHSRDQHLRKFIETKESVCIRKEFISHRTSLRHQHGRRLIFLGHQYGRGDVMWKHSIKEYINRPPLWKRSMLTSLSKFLASTEYQIFSSMRQRAKILAELVLAFEYP